MSFEGEKTKQMVPVPDKPNTIGELVGEAPNAILVVSGASKFNEKQERWVMGSFGDVDDSGMVAGGKDRIIAGAELHTIFPNSELVTMSQNMNPEIPTYASIQKQELVNRGVPAERILEEVESYRTVDGLKNTLLIARDKGWRKIVYVTSDYHVPRVQGFLDHLPDFSVDEGEKLRLEAAIADIKKGTFIVQVMSAEAILSVKDRRYAAYFEKVRRLPGYESRVKAEAEGVRDIEQGTYRYTGKK